MPIYNSARYLSAAIESVLNQSLSDIEILIIDDNSSDGSAEIAASYAERDHRIRFIRNTPNKGMVANWNYCLELARGDYIKYLFGDDLLSSPDNLKLLAQVLDDDQSIVLAGSARWNIDEYSNPVNLMDHFGHNRTLAGGDVIRMCLEAQKNLIGEPTVVIFRKAAAFRGFDLGYRQMVDLEMWLNLLRQGSFAYVSEPLVSFRIHEEQQTKVNARDMIHLDEMQKLYREYLPHGNLGVLRRGYLGYRQHYVIWKIYREVGTLGLEQARKKIIRYMPMEKFYFLLPLYKIATPLWKIIHGIDKSRQRIS